MPDLTPRRVPRQDRSRFTVANIVEAGARILRDRGYAAMTTNRVARLAGVSIGSLYSFFPNREAIMLAILQRRLSALAGEIEADLRTALQKEGLDSTRFLIARLVAVVTPDRELYRVLLHELPALRERDEVRLALDRVFEVGRLGAQRAGARIDLPDPAADVWLLIQMVGSAIIEICFADTGDEEKQRLIRELARLTFRMTRPAEPAG